MHGEANAELYQMAGTETEPKHVAGRLGSSQYFV